MTELENFITYYCKLTEEDINQVTARFSGRTLKKGRHILKSEQVCSELVYVIKGNLRIYYKDHEDKEITTWLIFDDMLATELISFITRQPSRFYVQALCDSQVAFISYADLHQLYNDIPRFQEFGRKIAEEIVVGAINRVISFQHETADKRYNRILEKSEYLQNIPLKYLASFLGVTDTSLSRIRRKK